MSKTEVRELFPVTRNVVYLNHAAVGPLSVRAYEAMERHARDQREFGALHWREWYHEYELLRQASARLINAGPDEIAILKNTSEGLSFVAEGFRWQRGDNVITTDLEFPSNFAPWKNLQRRGVELRVVESHDGAYTVDDVAKLIDARTRIVIRPAVQVRVDVRTKPCCKEHTRRAYRTCAATPPMPAHDPADRCADG